VKYNSSDEGVAMVDDSGHVKMTGSGEAAITLYYQSKVLYSRLSVPYPNKIDPAIYTKAPRNNFIDDLVIAKWKALNIAPSAPVTDSGFIRRAYLGPSCPPLKKSKISRPINPGQAQKLIDALIERDEFVDYWLTGLTFCWFQQEAAANDPSTQLIRDSEGEQAWDKFAREFSLHRATRVTWASDYSSCIRIPSKSPET
jgi:hypothetical protein